MGLLVLRGNAQINLQVDVRAEIELLNLRTKGSVVTMMV